MQKFPKPLCSDAFSVSRFFSFFFPLFLSSLHSLLFIYLFIYFLGKKGFLSRDKQAKVHNEEVGEASSLLITSVIPQFAQDLYEVYSCSYINLLFHFSYHFLKIITNQQTKNQSQSKNQKISK